MKNQLKAVGILHISIAFLLSGCNLTIEQAMRDDPGPYPDNYEQIIQRLIKYNLRDPSSVKDFSVTKPRKSAVYFGLLYGGAMPFWSSCAYYNAKNEYGGYVGYKKHIF